MPRRISESYQGSWKTFDCRYCHNGLLKRYPSFPHCAGKRVMPSWKHPLDKNVFGDAQGKPHWLCNGNWFPEETKIVVSKCGSVDREIICMVAHHINEHARKTIARSLPILLLIDGHSSRSSPTWLDVCQKSNIVVVRLPANTTQYCSLATSQQTKHSRGLFFPPRTKFYL